MKKILVVDNNLTILTLMEKILKKEGHHVITAKSGLDALDILKKYTPDVIFVDLVMPNIDGEKLCKIIRGMPKFKDVYIVILSAISAEEWLNISQLEANACIAKGPIKEMAQHVLYVIDKPDLAFSRCSSGEIIGIKNVYPRVITEELLSVKRHFEIVLEKMSEGILEINSEGRIVYANPAAYSLLNKSEKKLLSSHFIDFFSGDNRQRIRGLMKIKDDKPKRITEDAPVCLNGNQITINILSFSNKDGSKYIIILHDVTERKRAEENLKKAHDELEQRVEKRTTELLETNEELKREIKERKRAKDALKRANEELLKEHNQRKILSKRLIELLEKDRRQIAMELHDHIGQTLTSLKIDLEIIHDRLEDSKSELRPKVKTIQEKAVQIMRDVKNISHGLRPDMIDTLGLVPSLRELFNEIIQNTNIKINFFSQRVPKHFDQNKELAIYRIAQEALTNVIRHARAKNVFVNLVKKDDNLSLSVEDDGVGFIQDKAMKITKGKGLLGLLIIKERTVQLEGKFTIESQPGKGTHVLVEIPL